MSSPGWSEEGFEMGETRIYRKNGGSGRPKVRWGRVILVVFLGMLLFAGGMAYGAFKYIRDYPEEQVKELSDYEGRVNILVLGIDIGVNGQQSRSLKNATRSDTLIVVSVDPETKDVGVLSIPRDTRVLIPGTGSWEKIAHAHAYGGPSLAVKTVENFLGINIHHYIRIDYEGFVRAVDIVGGVEIDVPQDMNYEDPVQGLYIHLKKGRQVLDGQKALQFVRYRQYENGDIGRIQAQEVFLKALGKKVISLTTVWKVPTLLRELQNYVVTDLTFDEMLYLANLGTKVNVQSVKMAIVPGSAQMIKDQHGELSYWIPDRDQTEKVVDELVRGIDRNVNATIRVSVENGCGIAGAAERVAQLLRDQGYDVRSVTNASRQDYAESRVELFGDNEGAAMRVLRSVRPVLPASKPFKVSGKSEVDVRVIVGKDFKTSTGGDANSP